MRDSLRTLYRYSPLHWASLFFRRIKTGIQRKWTATAATVDLVHHYNFLAKMQTVALRHAAVLLPIVAVSAVAIQCLILARGDFPTANTVAASISFSQWATTAALSFVPLAATFLIQWGSNGGIGAPRPPGVWVRNAWIYAGAGVLALLIFMPIIAYAVVLIVILQLWLQGRPKTEGSSGAPWYRYPQEDVHMERIASLLREEDKHENAKLDSQTTKDVSRKTLNQQAIDRANEIDASQAQTRPLRTFLLASAAVLPLLFYASSLPPETISVGDEPKVGFVLQSDSEWLVLLHKESRKVEYIPTRGVRDRELCSTTGPSWTWAEPWLLDRPDYPECPKP